MGRQERKEIGPEDEAKEPIEAHGLVPLPQPTQVPDVVPTSDISPLPDWIRKPIIAHADQAIPFIDLPLSSDVISNLASHGLHNAFSIQASIIPLLLARDDVFRGDLCVSAATGSGKTLGYVLPMVEKLKGRQMAKLRGLVIVPTRELVSQVRQIFEFCAAGTGLKIGTAVGSKPLKEEQKTLIAKRWKWDPEAYKAEQEIATRYIMKRDSRWHRLLDLSDEEETYEDCVPKYDSTIDILVCTPGRLVDHMKFTKGFSLQCVNWLVVDEADRLLGQSFQRWVPTVVQALDKEPEQTPLEKMMDSVFHKRNWRRVRKIILSATMTNDLSKLEELNLVKPALVTLEGYIPPTGNEMQEQKVEPTKQPHAFSIPSTLSECVLRVLRPDEKPLHLLKLLQNRLFFETYAEEETLKDNDTAGETPLDSMMLDSDSGFNLVPEPITSETTESVNNHDGDEPHSMNFMVTEPEEPGNGSPPRGTLIFTNSNESALRLYRLLTLIVPESASEYGLLTKSSSSSARQKTLKNLRNGDLKFVIASDRLSRGLDVYSLTSVINYDVPTSVTSYVHRVGRTARAGKKGVAITFLTENEAGWFWAEIGRGPQIMRHESIQKGGNYASQITADDRKRYAAALTQLGKEARGET